MNVNLIKRIITQNSKKCDNIIVYRLLYNDGSCIPKGSRHSSAFVALHGNNRKSADAEHRRCFCQEKGPPAAGPKLPPLMDFPAIVWPSIFKSIKNLILTTFIIKPYLDSDFNLPDLVAGSKAAVEVISHKLSQGEDLTGLVVPEIIPGLQDSVSKMSEIQRETLALDAKDMYFSFPYQIGVIFNQDETDSQKRFVEITMVHHVLKGLSEMRSRGEDVPMNMGNIPEYQEKVLICNYRYIKEFTKGVESDWTVNLLNQFRLHDLENYIVK